MIYLRKLALLICFLVTTMHCSAQYFDGGLDFVGYLGVEPGSNTSGIFGSDVGLGKYISVGLEFRYLFSLPESSSIPMPFNPTTSSSRFGFSFRADVHGHNIFDMNKSDILVGYHRFNGANGVHVEYRRFLNEFFGFYVKPRYNFNFPRINLSDDSEFLDDEFFVQIGILFKTLSGDSYDVDW